MADNASPAPGLSSSPLGRAGTRTQTYPQPSTRETPIAGQLGGFVQVASVVLQNLVLGAFASGRSRLRQILPSGRDRLSDIHVGPRQRRRVNHESCDPAVFIERMRPYLNRSIQPAGIVIIDVGKDLQQVLCNAVGLEAALSSMLFHARREMQDARRLLLSAKAAGGPKDEEGIKFEVLVSSARCAAHESAPPGFAKRDQIGLTTARLFAKTIKGSVALDRANEGSLRISLWLPCGAAGAEDAATTPNVISHPSNAGSESPPRKQISSIQL